VALAGLSPGTLHLYEVFDGERSLTAGEELRFRTAPPPGRGFVRVVALGDSGTGGLQQARMADVLCGRNPDIFVHTGDLTYTFDFDTGVFEPYRKVLGSVCLFPARGNHDLFLPWEETFFPPGADPEGVGTNYSFDWGPAHFAVVDTNREFLADSPQLQWLDRDLAAARARSMEWLLLDFHEPPYSVGAYHFASARIRSAIEPIASRHAVDVVLSGHDHNYQRSHPIHDGVVRDAWQDPDYASPRGAIYLVTGGGGQILYPEVPGADHAYTRLFVFAYHLVELEIEPGRLVGRAVDIEGEVIDSFTIEKGRPRPPLELLRGDLNWSGDLTITDPILLLNHLFSGQRIDCPAAGEVEAPGSGVTITDAIQILNFLFLGGAPPIPPFPDCGAVPDEDDAFCTRAGCET
jgi:hypothetical protein